MPYASGDGVELYYETVGCDSDPPLVLVHGLGSQLLFWHDEFCHSLVDRGFFVVRIDNRDSGLSSHLPLDACYTLSDMARDVVAVLDAASIDRAHVVGHSLGGMIAQTLAVECPERTATLTSISASTGNLDYGRPTDEALEALTAPPPSTRAERIARDVSNRRIWASPTYFDEAEAYAYYAACYDRGFSETGGLRQFNAVLASGSRDAALAELQVPTLVIHGALDPLIGPDGGARTASLIRESELLMIDGMGHDLPVQVWQQVISAITALASRHAR